MPLGSVVKQRPPNAPGEHSTEMVVRSLVVGHHMQHRPVLFGLQDGLPPLPGQLLEAVRLAQRLVELPALPVVHLAERRVANDLLDAAAQVPRWPRAKP